MYNSFENTKFIFRNKKNKIKIFIYSPKQLKQMQCFTTFTVHFPDVDFLH